MAWLELLLLVVFILVIGLRIRAGLQYSRWYDQLEPHEQERENQRQWKNMQY